MKWRNSDPALGRFFGIDPISENFYYQTNYQFASNNPVWKIEIEGLEGKKTNNGTDLNDNNPVFLNSNIIFNTIANQQTKYQNLKNDVPIVEMGLGYEVSKSYTYGNDIANVNTGATAVNGNVCYSVCRNGEIVSYQLDVFQVESNINAGGENIYGEKFTTMSASGSYNLKYGTSKSDINFISNQVSSPTSTEETNSTFNSFIVSINSGPAFVNFDLGAIGNGLVDFGNLVMSWLDATVKENFGGGGDANPLNN